MGREPSGGAGDRPSENELAGEGRLLGAQAPARRRWRRNGGGNGVAAAGPRRAPLLGSLAPFL